LSSRFLLIRVPESKECYHKYDSGGMKRVGGTGLCLLVSCRGQL
jgi:hypothetical protein